MGVDTADAINKVISQLIPAGALGADTGSHAQPLAANGSESTPASGSVSGTASNNKSATAEAVATALNLALNHSDAAARTARVAHEGDEEAKSSEEEEANAAAKAARVAVAVDHAFATTVLVHDLIDVDDKSAQDAAAADSEVLGDAAAADSEAQDAAAAVSEAQDAAVADSGAQTSAESTAKAGATATKVAPLSTQELAMKCKRDQVEVALILNTIGGQQRASAFGALRMKGVLVDQHVTEINAMNDQALLKLEKAVQQLAAAKVKGQVPADKAAAITERDAVYLSYTACESPQADPRWNATVRSTQGAWGKKGAADKTDVLSATMLLVLSTQFLPAIEGLQTCPDAGKHLVKGVLSLPPSAQAKFDAHRGSSPFADVVLVGTGTPFTSVAIRLRRVPPPWQPTTVMIRATGPAAATMTVLQLVQAVRQTGVHLLVENVQQTIENASASAPSTTASDMLTAAMTAIKAATAFFEQAGGQKPAASAPPQNSCFLATLRLEDAQELPSRMQLMSAPGVATLLQVSGPGISACDKCGHQGHLAGTCRQKRALPPVRVYGGAYNASKTRPSQGKGAKAPQAKSLLHATTKRQPAPATASAAPMAASPATGSKHEVTSAVTAGAKDATAATDPQSGTNSPPANVSEVAVDDGGGPWTTVGGGGGSSSSSHSSSRANTTKKDRAAKAAQLKRDQAKAASAAEASRNGLRNRVERPGPASSNTTRAKGNRGKCKRVVVESASKPAGNAGQALQQVSGPHQAKAPVTLTPLQTDPPEQCVRNMGLIPNVVLDDTAAAPTLHNPQGRHEDGPPTSTDLVGAHTSSSATGSAEADMLH